MYMYMYLQNKKHTIHTQLTCGNEDCCSVSKSVVVLEDESLSKLQLFTQSNE